VVAGDTRSKSPSRRHGQRAIVPAWSEERAQYAAEAQAASHDALAPAHSLDSPQLALPSPNGSFTPVQGDVDLRAAIRGLLARAGMLFAPPGPDDYVLLVRGMPVAPWIPLRPVADVWQTWLGRLEALWEEWTTQAAVAATAAPSSEPGNRPEALGPGDTAESAPEATPLPLAPAWEAWQREHVAVLQARHTGLGVRQLAALLSDWGPDQGCVHIVGHSVGGATALAYLSAWQAGTLPSPRAPIRTVLTLDAALTGLAGVWSGARQWLGDSPARGLRGLGDWAARNGIAVLTLTNERDVWSHRAISDIPYLGLRLGPRIALRAHLDGSIHGILRRAPAIAEALWGSESEPPPTAS
jgi:hypothetical protein